MTNWWKISIQSVHCRSALTYHSEHGRLKWLWWALDCQVYTLVANKCHTQHFWTVPQKSRSRLQKSTTVAAFTVSYEPIIWGKMFQLLLRVRKTCCILIRMPLLQSTILPLMKMSNNKVSPWLPKIPACHLLSSCVFVIGLRSVPQRCAFVTEEWTGRWDGANLWDDLYIMNLLVKKPPTPSTLDSPHASARQHSWPVMGVLCSFWLKWKGVGERGHSVSLPGSFIRCSKYITSLLSLVLFLLFFKFFLLECENVFHVILNV